MLFTLKVALGSSPRLVDPEPLRGLSILSAMSTSTTVERRPLPKLCSATKFEELLGSVITVQEGSSGCIDAKRVADWMFHFS